MDLNMKKELFSKAYFLAVASVAGFKSSKPEFDDGIDYSVKADMDGYSMEPSIEVQLKCTAHPSISDRVIRYELPVKNYRDLNKPKHCLRYLVLVVVPEDSADWLLQTPEQLALKHCGYWVSLLGQPDTGNTETVTVSVPLDQVLSVEALSMLMELADSRARGHQA